MNTRTAQHLHVSLHSSESEACTPGDLAKTRPVGDVDKVAQSEESYTIASVYHEQTGQTEVLSQPQEVSSPSTAIAAHIPEDVEEAQISLILDLGSKFVKRVIQVVKNDGSQRSFPLSSWTARDWVKGMRVDSPKMLFMWKQQPGLITGDDDHRFASMEQKLIEADSNADIVYRNHLASMADETETVAIENVLPEIARFCPNMTRDTLLAKCKKRTIVSRPDSANRECRNAFDASFEVLRSRGFQCVPRLESLGILGFAAMNEAQGEEYWKGDVIMVEAGGSDTVRVEICTLWLCFANDVAEPSVLPR